MPAGAQRILGGCWRSGWLWYCGRSCWWCSWHMTKRSSPAGSGWGRRGASVRRVQSRSTSSEAEPVFLDLWADAESCCHTQGLPPATWLHLGITTLFSTSWYTLVLTFKLTSKMWGGMMWPSLETIPKTINIAGNFVFITLGTLNHLDLHFEGAGNGPVVITWIGREHGCTVAHLRSRSLNIVSLSDMIEGFYGSWDLYTTGQLVDCLQQKRKSVFIKLKWNHVIFSRATILSFYPVCEKKDSLQNQTDIFHKRSSINMRQINVLPKTVLHYNSYRIYKLLIIIKKIMIQWWNFKK